MGKVKDLTGQRFGKLLAMKDSGKRTKNRAVLWECVCDCGGVCVASSQDLQKGYAVNCGCLTKENDIIGLKFGRLRAIKKCNDTGHAKWTCECDCGKTVIALRSALTSGSTKSCGCLQRDNRRIGYNRKDFTGARFGALMVISRVDGKSKGEAKWLCLCDCGNKIVLKQYGLSTPSKGRVSCGCLNRSRTHAMSNSEEYGIWSGMKDRCYREKSHSYKHYGGRGIKVCDRWRDSFDNFYVDMGPRHNKGSIDRVDNDGDYEPGNCRWATQEQQTRNSRRNVLVRYNDCMVIKSDCIRDLGVSYQAWYYWTKKGLCDEQIISHLKTKRKVVKP